MFENVQLADPLGAEHFSAERILNAVEKKMRMVLEVHTAHFTVGQFAHFCDEHVDLGTRVVGVFTTAKKADRVAIADFFVAIDKKFGRSEVEAYATANPIEDTYPWHANLNEPVEAHMFYDDHVLSTALHKFVRRIFRLEYGTVTLLMVYQAIKKLGIDEFSEKIHLSEERKEALERLVVKLLADLPLDQVTDYQAPSPEGDDRKIAPDIQIETYDLNVIVSCPEPQFRAAVLRYAEKEYGWTPEDVVVLPLWGIHGRVWEVLDEMMGVVTPQDAIVRITCIVVIHGNDCELLHFNYSEGVNAWFEWATQHSAWKMQLVWEEIGRFIVVGEKPGITYRETISAPLAFHMS